VDVSESGYFDPANRKVKIGPFFGPFEDLGAQTLSYRVTPPLGDSGLRLFKGASLVDGVEGVISGDDVLDVIPLHPADAQPIDGWMTLGEVTGYAACWRRGLTWQFPPNPIQTKFVTQAIALWLGGEVYGFDSTQASAPYWWSVAADPLLYRREPPGVPPGAAATNGTALVTMPRTFAPGAPFEIVITVQPAAGVAVCAVEDELPEGWEVVLPAISEGAIYDPARRKVKWGPFLGAEPRRLTYQAIPPPLPDPVAQFGGGAAFDGSVGALAGRRQTFLAGAEPRLVFKSVSFSPDSGAAITASGATNEAYVVEVSPNLADWERWLTFTNTAAAVQLLDVTATNINQRFYRALWK
jgi:hypothetical protein